MNRNRKRDKHLIVLISSVIFFIIAFSIIQNTKILIVYSIGLGPIIVVGLLIIGLIYIFLNGRS